MYVKHEKRVTLEELAQNEKESIFKYGKRATLHALVGGLSGMGGTLTGLSAIYNVCNNGNKTLAIIYGAAAGVSCILTILNMSLAGYCLDQANELVKNKQPAKEPDYTREELEMEF